MRIVAIVQARMGSTRFAGKSMALIAGRPMLGHVLERAKRIPILTDVVLTTPTAARDRVLGVVAAEAGVSWWPDDHSDLLGCFVRCARARHADVIVRITADCPLLDPASSSGVILHLLEGRYDYASNVGEGTDGYDTEVMTMATLEAAAAEATDVYDRHHVTPWIRRQSKRFRIAYIVPATTPDGLKLSVDTPEDLERVRSLMAVKV